MPGVGPDRRVERCPRAVPLSRRGAEDTEQSLGAGVIGSLLHDQTRGGQHLVRPTAKMERHRPVELGVDALGETGDHGFGQVGQPVASTGWAEERMEGFANAVRL
jgi:hypothetical protein